MAQALIRKIDDDVLADYKAEAKRKGRSLEAELRDLIARNRPRRRPTLEERNRLMEVIVRGQTKQPDSTPLIRAAREELSDRRSG